MLENRPRLRSIDKGGLLVCGPVSNIGVGVQGMVGELLSGIDWEAVATDDMMW